MDEEIVVGKEQLRAIGSETRVAILKSLLKRQRTNSELSSELGISPPSALEQIAQLENAGLIEQVPADRERKWKYYRLTTLGRQMVERKRMNVVLVLSYLSAALTVGLIAMYLLVPVLLDILLGAERPAPSPPPVPSGSDGTVNLSSALISLEGTSRSFLGVLIMILLIATMALLAIYLATKKR